MVSTVCTRGGANLTRTPVSSVGLSKPSVSQSMVAANVNDVRVVGTSVSEPLCRRVDDPEGVASESKLGELKLML